MSEQLSLRKDKAKHQKFFNYSTYQYGDGNVPRTTLWRLLKAAKTGTVEEESFPNSSRQLFAECNVLSRANWPATATTSSVILCDQPNPTCTVYKGQGDKT